MNDYDILSDDEEETDVEPEICVEEKKIKTQKVLKMKDSNKNNFFKSAFSLNFLPITLSIISMFLTMFVKFIPLVSYSSSSYKAVGALFFISFGVALAGLVIEIIKMAKEKRFIFSVSLILPLVAIAILAI
ncbi:MAG: hypothetical protein ACI4L1_03195 [Christensenellales bacterium]